MGPPQNRRFCGERRKEWSGWSRRLLGGDGTERNFFRRCGRGEIDAGTSPYCLSHSRKTPQGLPFSARSIIQKSAQKRPPIASSAIEENPCGQSPPGFAGSPFPKGPFFFFCVLWNNIARRAEDFPQWKSLQGTLPGCPFKMYLQHQERSRRIPLTKCPSFSYNGFSVYPQIDFVWFG